MKTAGINDRIAERFDTLSPRLKQAARFVIDHPEEVALRSRRALAAAAAVPPTSLLRLARELDFENYEVFRETYRSWMRDSRSPLNDRVLTLRRKGRNGAASAMITEMVQRELTNISKTIADIGAERLTAAQRRLSAARRIYVLGLRSIYAVAFYFHYMCRTFSDKTLLLDGAGGTLLDDVRNIQRRDVLLVFSINPYSRDTVRAVNFVRAQGVPVVAVTDSELSPVARDAASTLIVSNSSEPKALTSVLPALAVAQVLITLLVAHSGEDSVPAIAASDRQLAALEVYFPTT